MWKRLFFVLGVVLFFSSFAYAQRVYSMRIRHPSRSTGLQTNTLVLTFKPGYHIFPSSGYMDSITNNTTHPTSLVSMNGFTIGEQLDWFVLPELSVTQELDRYSGEIRYIGGGLFKQTVMPLLLSLKYWAFHHPVFKPYIGAGFGAYFVNRKYFNGTITEQSSTQIGYHLLMGISFVINKHIDLGLEDRYAWARAIENSILNPLVITNTDDGGNSGYVFISINL